MNDPQKPLRSILGAALCDLVGYLDNLPDPIIVGERYSKERLVSAFADWCNSRGVDVKDADAELWGKIVVAKSLRGPEGDSDASTQ